MLTVENNESLALETHNDDLEPILHSRHITTLVVVAGNGATTRYTAEFGHACQHQVENLATNIVKVHVGESIWARQCLFQILLEAVFLVYA